MHLEKGEFKTFMFGSEHGLMIRVPLVFNLGVSSDSIYLIGDSNDGDNWETFKIELPMCNNKWSIFTTIDDICILIDKKEYK